jgi:hypothetical protein
MAAPRKPVDDGIDLSAGLEAPKPADDGIDLSAGLEDYPVTQTSPTHFQGPTVNTQQSIVQDVKNLGIGAAKGAGSTLWNLGSMNPDPIDAIMNRTQQKPGYLTPQGGVQGLGYGGEQAAEFFAPMGAEGKLASATTEAMPFLGKALPKIGAQALASGTVNKAQGGSFGGGAAAGLFSGALGAGVKAMAPTMAETAMGVRGADRANGRTVGQAIIQDTTGFTPRAVADSAESKIGSLTGELEGMHDAVSQRLTQRPPIRGALPAPTIDMPLHSAPDIPGTPSQPIILNQPNRPMPNLLPAPTRTIPSSSHADIFPDQLPQGTTNIPVQPPSTAPGMGPGQYLGQIPGDRGGPGQVQGVLRSKQTSFPAGDGTPYQIPLGEDAPSMGPARNIVQSALERAVNQNSPQLFNALQPVQDQLSRNFFTGANIADRVTPTEMLGYKRGIGTLEKNWPVETKKIGGDAIRGVYGALDSELDRTVPGSQQMNQRISSLFPVASRANAADLNANLLQRSLGRFARPTGALASAVAGGAYGYHKGGIGTAATDATIGLVAPEVLASPTVLMAGSRLLNSAAVPAMRGANAIAAQLFRTPKSSAKK